MAYISKYSGEELDAGIEINTAQNNRLTNLESNKVNKAGDTMTGHLRVPQLYIDNANDISRIKFNNDSYERAIININESNRLNFFSYGSDKSGYYEQFYLPTPDNGLTANQVYPILTQKNFLNMIYPVGSVYVTSTNTNPSSTLGGTWTLTDKEFSYASFSIADVFTANSTNCTSLTGTIIRNNHFFTIYFTLTPKVAITDSTLKMGQIKLSSIGASSINTQAYSSMSDGGQAVYTFQITNNGTFNTTDVMVRGSSTASSAASQAVNGYTIIPVTTSQMADSACSRFFWKRTA